VATGPAASKVVSQIKVEGMPMASIVSADGKELYVTTGRWNSVLIIDTKENTLAAKVPVGERVWGMALSPDGSKLYTANGLSNDVSVIDVKQRKEVARIKVGDGPWGVAIAPK
jgi:YVTN family beta-propeller protein